MTRLTLDTIALCAFDYRFNSFYQREMHPFVDAMVRALAEAGARERGGSTLANRADAAQAPRQYERDLAADARGRRRADRASASSDPNGDEKKDLLGLMLQGRDPVTGERPVGREHPLPDRDVPDRGPRDDQRPAVVRDLPPAARTRRCWRRRAPRSTRVLGDEHAAHRAPREAALHRADPDGDAAPVADRAGVRARAARRHDDRRRQVRGAADATPCWC